MSETERTAPAPTYATPGTCCTTHDGPHARGCTRPRLDDGRHHHGQCLSGYNEKGVQDLHTPGADGISPTEEGIGTVPADSIADPLGWEEDEDYARRQQLGLRPIAFRSNPDVHPDTSPCPSWCQSAIDDVPHTIKERHPTKAYHVGPVIDILMSYYPGSTVTADHGAVVLASTLGVWLTRGEGGTHVSLKLQQQDQDDRRLTFTLDDAEELHTVLGYLLAQARADDVMNSAQRLERNAFELGADAMALGVIKPSAAASGAQR